MDAFQVVRGETIDQTYVDGLSITHGSPRQHLWTLAVGRSEGYYNLMLTCPRDKDPFFHMFLTLLAAIFTVTPH